LPARAVPPASGTCGARLPGLACARSLRNGGARARPCLGWPPRSRRAPPRSRGSWPPR
jgi:hypothetical protein